MRSWPGCSAWQERAVAAFLAGYRGAPTSWPRCPDPEQAERVTQFFLLEKALYQIIYEAGNRPAVLHIPLRGVAALLADDR